MSGDEAEGWSTWLEIVELFLKHRREYQSIDDILDDVERLVERLHETADREDEGDGDIGRD